jgi:small subunit ribosomal protein S1
MTCTEESFAVLDRTDNQSFHVTYVTWYLSKAMNKESSLPDIGATVRGRVIRLLARGAILDISTGHKGILRASQLSWLNRRIKVDESLKIGDELDVVVLKVNQSKKSKKIFVSVGHRQTLKNPWETVAEKHPVGNRMKAKVADFLPFGAVVEFETGFRGLVHDSEVSWTEKTPKAKDFLKLGDQIEVVIQLVNGDKRRIHASYRLAIENPWLTVLEKYPLGTTSTGRVVSVRVFGVLVMLPNGCVGLLYKSNFPDAEKMLSLDDAIDVVILTCDQDKQRITFGCSLVSG